MNGFAERELDVGNFGSSKGLSVSAFDAFPKTKQTYLTQTSSGGFATILITLICIWLTTSEFSRWMTGTTTHTFSVEKGVAHDLQMNLDIVVAMKCKDLHVNVQDASGDRIMAGDLLKKDPTMWNAWMGQKGEESLRKKLESQSRERADIDGGDANGADPEWVKEQAEQYKKEEDVHRYLGKAKGRRNFKSTPKLSRGQEGDSCRIFGSIEGNKVQGDFHITARGHGYMEFGAEHVDHTTFNFSHHINELSFGPFFPNLAQPLDSTHAVTLSNFNKYQYYLSIVPTIYTDAPHRLTSSSPPKAAARAAAASSEKRRRERRDRARAALTKKNKTPAQQAALQKAERERRAREEAATRHQNQEDGGKGIDGAQYNPFAFSPHTIFTNQYAVTEQSHTVPESGVPGVFFKYDIEPILLTVAEEWGGVLGLFVRCVNVVAGVLVAGGWVVSLVDWAGEAVKGRGRRRAGSGGLLHGGAGAGGDGEKGS